MTGTLEDILKEISNAVAIELNAPHKDVLVVGHFSSDPLFSYLEISWGIQHMRLSSFRSSDLFMEPAEFINRFIRPAVFRLRRYDRPN